MRRSSTRSTRVNLSQCRPQHPGDRSPDVPPSADQESVKPEPRFVRLSRIWLSTRIATSEAEGEGFEPSVEGLPLQRFSRPPDSTTPAPLRGATVEGSDPGSPA